MYKGKTVLCVIPARGGSKGLPGKNIRSLLGKPLIAYSLEQAKGANHIDRVIVSTDDDQIAGTALRHGAEVPFRRPKSLSTDSSSVIDVLLHALDWLCRREKYSPDILVLLHATAPLRVSRDIDRCIEILLEEDAESVFSVAEAHRNPYFNMVEIGKNNRVKLVKKGSFATRQSAPVVYDMNASIYVWPVPVLRKKRSTILSRSRVYVMPRERSVDIDDLLDFRIAEMLLRERSADE